MSRYDWPVAPAGQRDEGEGDDPAGRARFNARRRNGLDLDTALRTSRATAPPPVRRRAGAAPGPFAPASGRQHLWQQLGPATVLGGQAEGNPRVSGRVNALCVHEAGLRIYAASANGGVWYSKDGGASWVSVAGLASTNTAGILRPAQRNACGALHVEFGTAEGEDLVFLGTGEVSSEMTAEPGDSEGGIGILVGDKPVKSVAADPWVREAPNLVNNGIYSIVREPGGSIVLAATLTGLYQRPAAPGANINWERPASAPFDALDTACTDLLWTPANGASPARCWVWVKDGAKVGLWVRDVVADEFKPVEVDAASPFFYTDGRGSLAAATPPTQVWVLGDQGDVGTAALFRVTNPAAGTPPVAHGVVGVPDVLRDQGFYDIAIAVDPANANRVALAGSYLEDVTLDGAQVQYNASIVVAEVAPDPGNGGVLTYGLAATPYTMIGVGVHPDVHALAYSNGGARLWTGCDGGVFRSDRPARPAGFYACNRGLSISESNYVAGHPRCEGHLIAGLQDNGVVTRVSSGVWKMKFMGDGGGVIMDAASPDHSMSQYVQGNWNVDATGGTGPLVRAGTLVKAESEKAAFYSMPACIANVRASPPAITPGFSQTLIGTRRLWYSDDFGVSWVTLPTATDPLPGNTAQDGIGQPITVCRWQSPDVAWVLCNQRLRRYERTAGSHNAGGPGTWTSRDVMPAGYSPSGKVKKRPPAPPSLLDAKVWTDIAVNLDAPPAAGDPPAQRGTLGALYVGTIGNADIANADTLWWFDGTDKWHPTGLRTDPNGVPAPVLSIACNPDFSSEVWVGTTVGVWRGVRTDHGADAPTWAWAQKVNGLPEAAVEDLAIFSDNGLVLLRAAIASRGVWELRLDVADVQDLTYVRAHDDDLRHRPRAVEKQRDLTTDRSWHGSPDVRPRLAPAAVAAPATLSWRRSTFPGATEPLRRFQAALRSSTKDPRIFANGVWDAYFSEVLRDHGVPTVTVAAVPSVSPEFRLVEITKAFWNLHMKPPHATAEAWDTVVPTEDDLLELTPELREGELSHTSCTLKRGPAKVDIVVHHRGLDARDGGDVRVTLLKWIDPKTRKRAKPDDPATWFSGPVPWTAAVNEVLNSATGSTAQAFGAGWSFVGTTNATRRLALGGQTLDPLHAGVASFDLNLGGLKNNTVVLLVAVIRAGAGIASDIALAPATLQELALTRPEVAVRSVCVTT
ncbi:hypothetical protein QTH89_26090 [Variovorax sp. J22G21]|uniref:hypothetical protein n=1 Tax=Variovorax fucosicus TaxID=3053517 RepID=UPI002575AF01|nr:MULTISPECIES: hypothetical protein [unclassified Variovorax]MDM0042710.1 hypothetical protein [Variovorax sp. J22R193]MDM0064712.1 hypothetical protein [Variovorax sp. J22G21]